ncbi:hypothetical protein SAMN04487995_4156 [Dyadobacter koreensis]|uniref:Uncharacterized protein n=1 Tax=Dyadobacter koreensis TaxID=408657 RepID=A0A1H6XRA9_9BACT|nr:hypothetical protein [Dyadobacter koreensis]SEJ31579.1 hypothetical protein SAMN04487995_4156 [Dyadobacter koreensis]
MKSSAEHIQETNFNVNDDFEQFQDSTNPFLPKVRNTESAQLNKPGKRRRIMKPLYSVRLS